MMPKTILLPNEPMPAYSLCVCAMQGLGGSVFFSYYAETSAAALQQARRWSGGQLLYAVRVKPKMKPSADVAARSAEILAGYPQATIETGDYGRKLIVLRDDGAIMIVMRPHRPENGQPAIDRPASEAIEFLRGF